MILDFEHRKVLKYFLFLVVLPRIVLHGGRIDQQREDCIVIR